MLPDIRFYELKEYTCPRCWRTLSWEKYPESRKDRDDSLFLVHRGNIGCPNEGKFFYPPVVTFTEVSEEART